MTAKQKYAFDKVIGATSGDVQDAFREVAEYAISLGYMPKLNADETYADFIKSKVKRMLIKIDTDFKYPPRLAMNFFAISAYTGIFAEAIEYRTNLLTQLGHTPRCWGCKKCDGSRGYNYEPPDGRKIFLCGRGAIDIPSFGIENVTQIKDALKIQDEFFMNEIKISKGELK